LNGSPVRERRRPSFEPLEGRQLLSYTFSVEGTMAIATGDDQSDTLTIGAQGGLLFHSVNGSAPSFDWSDGAAGQPGLLPAAPGSTVNIDQGGGTDAINLVSSSAAGASLGGAFFNVLGGGPADTLQVDDSADATAGNTYDLTGTTLDGPGIVVSLNSVPLGGGITLLGGTAGNTIKVDSTDAGQPVTVVANGNDSVTVGAGILPGVISSTVTVSGAADSVTLAVDDSRDDAPQTFSLAGNPDGTSTLSGFGSGALTATTASLKSYTVLGGVIDDSLSVDTSTASPVPSGGLTFNGGLGNDTLDVDAGGRGGDVSGPGVVALAGIPPIHYANVEAVNVNNAADLPLTPTPQAVRGTEGTPLDQVIIVSFTDADPNGQAGNFSAQIDWGDGAVSAGTVVVNSGGGFDVLGSHTYVKAGAYPFMVTVIDNGTTAESNVGGVPVTVTDPGGASFVLGTTAQIADAPLSAQGLTVNSVEGTPFSGAVATFTDADPNAAASDYTVAIDWGITDVNGAEVVSPGTVAPDGSGGFTVSGTNTYPEEGTFPIKVTINDFGGASAIANGTANVAGASLSAQGLTVTPTEGLPFSGAVATFTDANPNGAVSDYTATIDWGIKDANGAEVITSGAVAPNPAGGFVVDGVNTYPEEGTFPITVTVRDAGGASAVANSTAHVADAPLSAQGVTVVPAPGQSFTGVVATFTDANPNAAASEFSATIDWGVKDANGSEVVTGGTVAPAAGGGFAVSGTNTYPAAGTFAITVAIRDVGGASAVANSTADVGVKPFRLVVTTTADLVNGAPADGSLRANILAANAHPGADTIIFDIVPRAGLEDIRLDAPLPPVTDPVNLDATTQPGYAGQPIVMVNGAATTGDGLTFNVGNSTVRGLVIAGFSGAGIRLAAGGGDLIQNDVIGTDASGQSALGNGVGILVDAGAGTTIGGTAAGAGNTISGNLTAGVYVNGPASATEIVGNRIGTNPAGTAAVVRGGVTDPLGALQNTGVVVVNSGGNSVHGNVISGNYVGVMLAGNGPGGPNRVQGNRIGTDASGTAALGNIVGVYINGSAGNLVGGTSAGNGNTVSGNSSVGIEILGGAATGNQVEGNLIGPAADGGTLRNANGTFVQPTGVFIQGASGNAIGGASPGAGNTITGNQSAGVFILSRDGTASGNVVQGDFIGLGPGGTPGPGNTGYGVLLYNASGNRVVGTGPSATRFGRNGLGNVQVFNGPLPASSSALGAPVVGKSARRAPAHRPVRSHPRGPLHRHRKPRAAH
jgi:hypothetical protein